MSGLIIIFVKFPWPSIKVNKNISKIAILQYCPICDIIIAARRHLGLSLCGILTLSRRKRDFRASGYAASGTSAFPCLLRDNLFWTEGVF
jgi:hypothetical protein